MKTRLRWMLATLLCASLVGCEYDEDDDDYDHDVPADQGSLIVDNNTADDLAIYIDGERVEDTDDYDEEAYDLEPGVHRVVLDQRSGSRSFSDDVDIIEGRRTIIAVSIEPFDDDYDVDVFFD